MFLFWGEQFKFTPWPSWLFSKEWGKRSFRACDVPFSGGFEYWIKFWHCLLPGFPSVWLLCMNQPHLCLHTHSDELRVSCWGESSPVMWVEGNVWHSLTNAANPNYIQKAFSRKSSQDWKKLEIKFRFMGSSFDVSWVLCCFCLSGQHECREVPFSGSSPAPHWQILPESFWAFGQGWAHLLCLFCWLLCGALAGLSGFWALEKDFYQCFASLLHTFSCYKKKKKVNKISINLCFLTSE